MMKMKNLLVFGIVSMFLLTSLTTFSAIGLKTTVKNEGITIEKGIQNTFYATGEYMPHEPIYINGDENFISDNGVLSVSGIESDPYIIEGWEIDLSKSSLTTMAGIHVLCTDSYLVVRNC